MPAAFTYRVWTNVNKNKFLFERRERRKKRITYTHTHTHTPHSYITTRSKSKHVPRGVCCFCQTTVCRTPPITRSVSHRAICLGGGANSGFFFKIKHRKKSVLHRFTSCSTRYNLTVCKKYKTILHVMHNESYVWLNAQLFHILLKWIDFTVKRKTYTRWVYKL